MRSRQPATAIKERQQRLIEVTKTAPIIVTFGMRLSYNDKDEAVWDMPHNPGFDHALDGIHGGVFATLLDNAGWFTAAPHYDHWLATVEFQIRLLEPAQNTDLRSIGHIVKLGKRFAIARMEVVTPVDGKTVAVGSGTFAPTSVKALF